METKEAETTEENIRVENLPEDYPQYDLSFKLIFIGDSGVGKSCLTSKAVKNTFEDYYQATVGFEFLTYNLKLNDKVIKMQIWDTCGQEIYKSLITNFYRNSSLAIVTYSIDNKESFVHAENWLSDLRSQASPDVRVFLVGNKADLEAQRKVSKEDGEKYKEEQHLDMFMETSAKTGYNAKTVLIEAAKVLYKDYLNFVKNIGDKKENKNDNKLMKQQLINKDKKNKKGCC